MADHANKVFVDQSETPVATIGSNYLQNFLSGGKVERGIGVLTQKRFYYKGQNFSGEGTAVKKTMEEGVVSIEDITFTKFTHTRNLGLALPLSIIGAALFVLTWFLMLNVGRNDPFFALGNMIGYSGIALVLASIPFYIIYFVKRQTLFQISFPGGSFGFDIRYYPIADIRDFQRQLHLMKDHIKENA